MTEQLAPSQRFVLIATVLEGGLIPVAIALGWLVGLAPARQINCTLPALGWGVLACTPPLAVLWTCVRWPIGPLARILQVMDQVLSPLLRPCPIAGLAVISAMAGLGEELLFRGVIQQGLAQWLGPPYGVWSGLAVGSLLFGLAHTVTRAYGVWATIIGLYLGGLWLVSGNLLVPITTHAAYDFLALVYLVKMRESTRNL